MKYTIIEDCSPYYITFTHDGIDEYIEFAKQGIPNSFKSIKDPCFINYNMSAYNLKFGADLVAKTPISQQIPFRVRKVGWLVTGPHKRYHIHKDGHIEPGDQFAINYTVHVRDDLCTTRWYDEADINRYRVDSADHNTGRSIILPEETVNSIVPLKATTFKPNQVILFNTELWHDWDNSKSPNPRLVLTFRQRVINGNHSVGNFFDARRRLFGY
jgi:hypothetical protein